MLLSESTLTRCLEAVIASQTPWGEWGGVSRVPKLRGRDIPKPNGFRTLLGLRILEDWLDETGRREPKSKAVRWFEDSIEDGWVRFYDTYPRQDVPPIGAERGAHEVVAAEDIRHTAQAITCFARYSKLNLARLDILRNIVGAQDEKTGGWPLRLGGRPEPYSTMSCLEMLGVFLSLPATSGGVVTQDDEFRDELESSFQSGLRSLEKNLFTTGKYAEPFSVAVCVAQLRGFAYHRKPSVERRARRFLADSWDETRGCWSKSGYATDEIEMNAFVYAAFSEVADFKNTNDNRILRRTASYLDETLADYGEVAAYLYSLIGHQAICRRTGREYRKRSLAAIRASDSFAVVLYGFYAGYLATRLRTLVALQRMRDPESAAWRRVMDIERQRTLLLARQLSTTARRKQELPALKCLIDSIEGESLDDVCEKALVYLSAVSTLREEPASKLWLAVWDKASDLGAKVLAELVKSGLQP